MPNMNELLQTADWKTEKHVPVIECKDKIKKGDTLVVNVSIGKEIPHPNTTEHYIAWAAVFFLPKGEKFPYEIGRVDFAAHGASIQGPNTSTVYTHPDASFVLKTEKPGTIMASSYCNIHGLWQSSKELVVE